MGDHSRGRGLNDGLSTGVLLSRVEPGADFGKRPTHRRGALGSYLKDGDDGPQPGVPIANEINRAPACPFCGDSIWMGLSSDGTSTCAHDGIEVWIPHHLRDSPGL
jgi:hypothetical protein